MAVNPSSRLAKILTVSWKLKVDVYLKSIQNVSFSPTSFIAELL